MLSQQFWPLRVVSSFALARGAKYGLGALRGSIDLRRRASVPNVSPIPKNRCVIQREPIPFGLGAVNRHTFLHHLPSIAVAVEIEKAQGKPRKRDRFVSARPHKLESQVD